MQLVGADDIVRRREDVAQVSACVSQTGKRPGEGGRDHREITLSGSIE
jgi:hypothetical protein